MPPAVGADWLRDLALQAGIDPADLTYIPKTSGGEAIQNAALNVARRIERYQDHSKQSPEGGPGVSGAFFQMIYQVLIGQERGPRFGSFAANEDVDLVVEPGQIHCLLGENGAGKSTLMNVLYGLYRPSGGRILVDGAEVSFRGPGDAMAAGIGMVHQHFMLVPTLTVAENIALGLKEVRTWFPRLEQLAAEIDQLRDICAGEGERLETGARHCRRLSRRDRRVVRDDVPFHLRLGESELLGDLSPILPILTPGASDSASFDEVVIAMFISGGNNPTLTRNMFNALRDQIDPTIAVIRATTPPACTFTASGTNSPCSASRTERATAVPALSWASAVLEWSA
mgnify:CR=1 FL=1